jgi:Protein of unknown function (DUF3501)
MKPVSRGELLDLAAYEQIREHFRRRIIAAKEVRRVALGSNMTVLFENHDSVLYQIQEMLRTERITAEKAIAHEIETYNELVPQGLELSATVFIEYPERAERERMLVVLAGVESAFYVRVGEERVAVVGDSRGTDPERTMAVQYVKFPLSERAHAAFMDSGHSVRLGVEHPAYQAEIEVPAATLKSLRQDFDEDA